VAEFVVITGPIGAGKSTVALALAERLRDEGYTAAEVDLDDVFEMVSAWSKQSDESLQRARLVHGALVAAWLRSGVDAVIAHGPFYTPEETTPLLAEIDPNQQPRWVMLLAPFEVALERVQSEPWRNLSRYPDFLRATHERFNALLTDVPPCEWVFDTTRLSPEEIVSTLAASLFPRSVVHES
jgi:thymidylate kinase